MSIYCIALKINSKYMYELKHIYYISIYETKTDIRTLIDMSDRK